MTEQCNYQKKPRLLRNIITAFWSLLGALFFTFIVYSLNIFTGQFVTAKEIKPLEKNIQAINIHYIYIKNKLDSIEKEIRNIKNQ